MAKGIRDKVAIIGMGCSRFGERWDCGPDELMLESYTEALADAGIDQNEIEAAWFGLFFQEQSAGKSALPLSLALRLPNIPVTRVENMCATGTEALRGAVYAVAAGACDTALAIGVEKLKDTGYGGLPERSKGTFDDLWLPSSTAPGNFAQLASAYAAKHKRPMEDIRKAMAAMIAYPLGLYDCCGVSDGSACAIVTTVEKAKAMGIKDMVTVKAIQLAPSNGFEMSNSGWDGSYFHTTRIAAQRAYAEAGITNPRQELDMMEVHDCFSITELVVMEDLGIAAEGQAVDDVLNGVFDRDGEVPCQVDGGLKCFGHPIGASGLRMAYEMYLQLLGRAGERQIGSPSIGLTHNLGGAPNRNVASVSVFGLHAG